MDLIMDIAKRNKFNFLKKKIEGFGQQSKSLDNKNKRLARKTEIWKNPDDL